ncbi:MAG TPA: hypothetical protein VNS22_11055 [Geminicoccus sp.]|uniref:hypothetical protein n=1 Tax=Geminicoccus sp. TaxID=2024832 RepID=UPI002D0CABA9|nr:hypothetical protein [Geminicoccus sp.]HWL68910.1 hypothetical protein [Geminicoccus sp.]
MAVERGVGRLVGPVRDDRHDALGAECMEQPSGRAGLASKGMSRFHIASVSRARVVTLPRCDHVGNSLALATKPRS